MILSKQKLLRRGVRSAFTLMEMMVVVAILVVLVGVAVPSYMSYLESSKEKRARSDVETISQIVQKFQMDQNRLPQGIQELTTTQQPGGNAMYLKPSSAKDPWEQDYVVDPSGAKMQSVGGDGADVYSQGRPGANNPIGNWTKAK
jgi:type II secretion system protein G